MIDLVGSYAEWPKWKVIRYNFFEIKEQITLTALTNRGGFIDSLAWDEYLDDELEEWTEAQPLELIAAQLVEAIVVWTKFHEDEFELGFGPSFSRITDPAKQDAEAVAKVLEHDVFAAVDYFVTNPLVGEDATLFGRVVKAYLNWATFSNTSELSIPIDVTAAFELRKSWTLARTENFLRIESWVDACLRFQSEYFSERLELLQDLSVRVRSTRRRPVESADARTAPVEYTEQLLESLRMSDAFTNLMSGGSDLNELVQGTSDFKVGAFRFEFEPKVVTPSSFLLEDVFDWGVGSNQDDEVLNTYAAACEELEFHVNSLRIQMEKLLEAIVAVGLSHAELATRLVRTDSDFFATIYQALETLDIASLPAEQILPPQLLAVWLSRDAWFNCYVDLDPMGRNLDPLPQMPEQRLSNDMYQYMEFIHRLQNRVQSLRTRISDRSTWDWFREEIDKGRSLNEIRHERQARVEYEAQDDEVEELKAEIRLFAKSLDESSIRTFFEAVINRHTENPRFFLHRMEVLGFDEGALSVLDLEYGLKNLAAHDLVGVPTRDDPLLKEEFELREVLLTIQKRYFEPSEEEIIMLAVEGIEVNSAHRRRRYQEIMETAMIDWIDTHRETHLASQEEVMIGNREGDDVEPTNQWDRIAEIGETIHLFNQSQSMD